MKVKKVTKSAEMCETYDLEVEGIHEYVIENNIVCHNTSLITNSTNGVEPPRAFMSYKKSKAGTIPMLVPGYEKYKKNYVLAFDIKDNRTIVNVLSGIVKFLDMSISTNFYYSYRDYEDEKLPDSILLRDTLYAYKMGIPALYYLNTDSESLEGYGEKQEPNCDSGACAI